MEELSNISTEIDKLLLKHGDYYTNADRELAAEQLDIEVSQYHGYQASSIEKNLEAQKKGNADITPAGFMVIKKNLEAVSAAISEYLGGERGRGRKPDAYKVFEHNKPEELAIAILRAVLKEVFRKNEDDEYSTENSIAMAISKRIEESFGWPDKCNRGKCGMQCLAIVENNTSLFKRFHQDLDEEGQFMWAVVKDGKKPRRG